MYRVGRKTRTGSEIVHTIDEHTVDHLTGLADLAIPADRLDLVAAALAPLISAANELSRKMSADEMRAVKPAIGFVPFHATGSQPR